MKQDIHPTDYRDIVIQDSNSKFAILTKSTAATEETVKWKDGKEYPLLTVHISSESHPFYTGQEKVLDIEGRVDKFKARAKAAAEKKEAATSKAKKNLSKQAAATDDTKQKIGDKSQSNNSKPKNDSPKKPQEDKAKDVKTDDKPAEEAKKDEATES